MCRFTFACDACEPAIQPWRARQGPLLKALSSYRYLAHAFAPILALVAAEQAARAGVHWADSPFFLGAPLLMPCMSQVSHGRVSCHQCVRALAKAV